MNHSAEPWSIDPLIGDIVDANGNTVILGLKDVCFMDQSDEQAEQTDTNRIVTCVNFLAGTPTELLKSGRFEVVIFWHQGDTVDSYKNVAKACARVVENFYGITVPMNPDGSRPCTSGNQFGAAGQQCDPEPPPNRLRTASEVAGGFEEYT